jgi:AraC-like DNA-binding protein
VASPITLSLDQVRHQILQGLDALPAAHGKESIQIDAVAAGLHVSRRTLQRRLRDLDTSFTRELCRLQVVVGVGKLLAGASVGTAASGVGLTPDHFRLVVREELGMSPGDLVRCRDLHQRLRRWRRRPARAGTRLYRRRLGEWPRHRSELHGRLGRLPAGSPLRPWADKVLAQSLRPDFRSSVYRREAEIEQKREQERFNAWLSQRLFPPEKEPS